MTFASENLDIAGGQVVRAVAAEKYDALVAIVRKMLSVENDHMTACDRIMGATHPCTCGANEARRLLTGDSAQ